MSERLRFVVSGFFVGLAELLPGISGSTVAVAFNVYEKFITFLSNLKLSNLTINFKRLNEVFFLDLIIPFFIAMGLSVLLASRLILYLYSEYTEYFSLFLSVLMCLISLLIILRLKKEFNTIVVWNYYFLAGIIFGILLNLLNFIFSEPSLLALIIIGFIAFSFFLMPGISGSAILLSIGVYEIVIGSIANIDLKILLPFGVGCIGSLILMPKFINYLLAEYKLQVMTFFASLILVSGVITSPFMSL